MNLKPADRISALEARLSAVTLLLTELIEAVDHRMAGVKAELVEALQVNEHGAGDAHSHPAGADELRRLRETLWIDWPKT
jgi:hypothetical protein